MRKIKPKRAGARAHGPGAHGPGPMGQGPWARAHGPRPMGQGPWAGPMGPPQSLRFRGPGRARAQAGEKNSEKSTFWENWDPRKGHFGQFLSKCPNVNFFEKRNPAKPAKIQVSG